MQEPKQRPLYSRHDLDWLKGLDRAAVFKALGSFDEAGLGDGEFVLKAAELLDTRRVPGLAQAKDATDAAAVLQAVTSACRERGVSDEPWATAPQSIEQAQAVLAHRFTFYDETHQLPAEMDWDFNPGTAHWGHDLNRFSYLHLLVLAWRQTGDDRFARKAIALMLDWIRKCDLGKAFTGTPYVFGSYLNMAIHCRSWASCLQRLLPADMVQPDELVRILKSLHDQLAHLEIVTNGHTGNWPTIGCQGMLATLAALPVFRDTDRFADYCVRTLAEQIAQQVLPDGVQDELTPHYHYVVINNLLSAIPSARALGRELPPRTLHVLKKMVHYAQQATLPDGSGMAGFNDSDPDMPADCGPRLAALGLKDFLSPPERLGPELFPHAGVAFLRQRQHRGDLYLAFDGGPYGRSHQHEDKLGFCLFAYGRVFLVDPGRHLYDWSEASCRPHLITSRAHSVILVDGQGQHSRGRPDTWIPRAPASMDWSITEHEVRACAAYDLGYGEDNSIHVVHRREIVFVRERFWVVFDHVEGEGEHAVELRFQFAPCGLRVEGTRASTRFEDANLLLWSLSSAPFAEVHVEEGQQNPRGGWYSPAYGRLEPAPCLSMSARAAPPVRTATLLFPYRGAREPRVQYTLEGGAAVVETNETGRAEIRSNM